MKDCCDCNYTEEDELCYEYLGMYSTISTSFSIFCRHTYNVYYCDYLVDVKNSIGCSNLRNGEYCILNKKYSKEEYEKLASQVIEKMIADKEWGEFLPMKYSPFAYNESVANEFYPLSEEQAIAMGLKWMPKDLREYQKQIYVIPEKISEVSAVILNEILACKTCGKNYKIVAQELEFYKKMNLSIPEFCPDCRHLKRLGLRNPRKLFERKCSKCSATILTTFAPERPEIVCCDKCYLETVY
jgi:hypothetical protein